MVELIHQTDTAENNWKLPQSKKDPRNQTVKKLVHFLVCSFSSLLSGLSFELRTFAKTKLNRSTQTNRSKKKANYLTLLEVVVVYFFYLLVFLFR